MPDRGASSRACSAYGCVLLDTFIISYFCTNFGTKFGEGERKDKDQGRARWYSSRGGVNWSVRKLNKKKKRKKEGGGLVVSSWTQHITPTLTHSVTRSLAHITIALYTNESTCGCHCVFNRDISSFSIYLAFHSSHRKQINNNQTCKWPKGLSTHSLE